MFCNTHVYVMHALSYLSPLHYYSDFKIQFVGKRLDDTDSKLCDLNLEEGDYFVVEFKQMSKDWYLQADNEGKCEGCYQLRELPFPCACKKVAYCTESCKDKDKRYHLSRCPVAEEEELNQKIEMKIVFFSIHFI